jgi:hypothetical protein
MYSTIGCIVEYICYLRATSTFRKITGQGFRYKSNAFPAFVTLSTVDKLPKTDSAGHESKEEVEEFLPNLRHVIAFVRMLFCCTTGSNKIRFTRTGLTGFSLHLLNNVGENGKNHTLCYTPVLGRESNMGTIIDEKGEGDDSSAHTCRAHQDPSHDVC